MRACVRSYHHVLRHLSAQIRRDDSPRRVRSRITFHLINPGVGELVRSDVLALNPLQENTSRVRVYPVLVPSLSG